MAECICGHCGYPTQGLPSLTCPECGSDLREVGIVHPGAPRWVTLLGPLWAIALIILVPALILNWLLDTMVSRRVFGRTEIVIPITNEPINRIQWISAKISSDGPVWELGSLTLTQPSSSFSLELLTSAVTTLHVDERGYCDQPIKTPRILDANCIKEWLNAGGIDSTTPASHRLVSEIMLFAEQVRKDHNRSIEFAGYRNAGNTLTSISVGVFFGGWVGGIPVLVCIVIWICAVGYQIRQRENIMRRGSRCDHCGVNVVGAAGVSCTNCGIDLRSSGIEVRREYLLTGLAGPLSNWALYLCGLGIIEFGFGTGNNASRLWLLQLQWLLFVGVWTFLTWRLLKKRRRELAAESGFHAKWRSKNA